ncbi:hypothetical protein ACFU8W_39800 [Streptomyces sp. NPDC057565]|uniref:hypothetical protein n=1 Tax=Streptomyces sp. NPDC057565 TaxID=3346169 RepID=UPI003687AA04
MDEPRPAGRCHLCGDQHYMQGPWPVGSFDPVGFDDTGPADQPVIGLRSAELQHSPAKIRRQSYAVTVGTISPETAGLTAPIRGAMGTAVAAVGMVTPVETFRPLGRAER